MTFSISTEERGRGAILPDKLTQITTAIGSEGYAVVDGLISLETCDLLMASVLEDAASVKALGKPTPHEKATGQGHLQLGLRRFAPYVRPDLITNPLIENVVNAVLGSDAWLGFYSGNVNVPGSGHQPLHFDRPFSWKTKEEAEKDGQSWPPPTTTLSCSVALCSITEENGATEIYPGTQRETEVTTWPPGERVSSHPDLIERWGPPQRMEIPAGGICFRDPRMWHRGVPNPTQMVRPMIAMTYHSGKARHWSGRLAKDMTPEDIARCVEDPTLRLIEDGILGDGRLVFEENAREIFESNPSRHAIDRNVRFIEAPLRVNHFHGAHRVGGASVVDDRVVVPH
jgi:hypothetical protein